jgi:excisionase family DNA binding protein
MGARRSAIAGQSPFTKVREFKQAAGIAKNDTIYRAIARGEIPAVRICNRYRIPRWALDRLKAGLPIVMPKEAP